jgi:hypothetical protein
MARRRRRAQEKSTEIRDEIRRQLVHGRADKVNIPLISTLRVFLPIGLQASSNEYQAKHLSRCGWACTVPNNSNEGYTKQGGPKSSSRVVVEDLIHEDYDQKGS